MKPLFLTKCTMALMIAAIAGGAYAEETNDEKYILNEDFEELTHTYTENYNGWKIVGWNYVEPNQAYNNLYLRIGTNTIGKKTTAGYAITPKLNYAGDVLLKFNYLKTISDAVTFSISITGGGTLEGPTSFSTENLQLLTPTPVAVKIINFGNDTQITFKEGTNTKVSYGIDDVKIIKLGEVTLDEAFNPAEAIAANATTSVTVNTPRTLYAGIWNTLCLPFDVTKSQLETAFDTSVELRTFSSYSAADKVMNFIEANNIEAGTPFLVKPTAIVFNPSFTNVTLSTAEAKTVTNDGVSFVGTYGPTTLATDGTELFITKKNNLARPKSSEAATLPGLRAYITVPENFTGARLMIAGEATGVSSVAADEPTTAPIYNLQGQRLRQLSKGVNIVDGKLIMK